MIDKNMGGIHKILLVLFVYILYRNFLFLFLFFCFLFVGRKFILLIESIIGFNKNSRIMLCLIYYLLVLIFMIYTMYFSYVFIMDNYKSTYFFLRSFIEENLINKSMNQLFSNKLNYNFESMIENVLFYISSNIFSMSFNFTKASLKYILTFIVGFIFLCDYEKILNFIDSNIIEIDLIQKVYSSILDVLLNMIKIQVILNVITFVILSIGFRMISINQSVMVSFLICCLDILPIIGVGFVMIPLSVYYFIVGDYLIGIFVIVLLMVINVIKQFLEPKMISKSYSIHSIVVFVLLLFGFCLDGIYGMMMFPIVSVILYKIYIDLN